MKTECTISHNIFELPVTEITPSPFVQKLNHAFLNALSCTDVISRFVLLYYLFEILYGTVEFQILKREYETSNMYTARESSNKKRSKLLYQYLLQEFNLKEYRSLGKQCTLSTETLEEIILARNDLTHRGDISNLSKVLYHHLLPILQQVIISLKSGRNVPSIDNIS